MPAIVIDHIRKTYPPGIKALEGVSLEVRPGELFGLIGPDGAGKTTLMRVLTSLILADSGSATVEGLDVVKDFRKLRKQIGYMPGRFSLYQDLSVLENLRFFATIFGTTIEANYHLIRDIYQQIEPFKHRKAGKLSGGMKQKLALSCALIHSPSVIFLDEPTTGVDAVSRREFWEMLQRLKARGITMLVSTPYMDEAGLCDRVALIQKGRILSIDTPAAIVNQFARPLLAVRTNETYRLVKDLRIAPWTHSAYPFGEFIHLASHTPVSAPEVRQYLENRQHTGILVQPIEPTIEDCFIELMHES